MSDVTAGTPAAQPALSAAYRRYALTVLMLIYTLNFLDRQIVTILAEPIKNDLNLADWQIGAMSGAAFAILYTLLGIPIARYADYGNRPLIISISVALWSGFTILCGFAQNFVQLALARVGVGIGEAGCTPPSHSLISDYVPKEKRASALAFYSLGTPLGALGGMIMGGLIADSLGWRWAFIIAGLPGILAAIVTLLTLFEPRMRQVQADRAALKANAPKFSEAVTELRTKPTFWFVAFGVAVVAFNGYGSQVFIGPFFFRNHMADLVELSAMFGLKPLGFLGVALGLISGAAAMVGVWLGGFLAERYGDNPRAHMMIPTVGGLLAMPVYVASLLIPSGLGALLLFAIPTLFASLWYGPVYGSVQGLVRPATRATAAAILLLIANLIGLGMGPLFTGLLSDLLAQQLGPAEGVRWALLIFGLFGLVGSWCFWMASKTIQRDTVS